MFTLQQRKENLFIHFLHEVGYSMSHYLATMIPNPYDPPHMPGLIERMKMFS
jgi:hypothetical protein